MNWNKIRHAKWFIPVLVVLAVAMITGAVLATPLVQHSIAGTGTIKVTPTATEPTFNFSINNAGPIDFSGGATQNQAGTYTCTIQINVTNTGVNGTNGGALATINSFTVTSVPASAVGWPVGATVTGSGGPLTVGDSENIPATLTIPASDLTDGDITLPAFNVVVTAN